MSTAPDSALAPRPLQSESSAGLFVPCLIVFLSGFCVMVIELVASRLVSRYIGASLYTWTTVIGVILAGISVGSYIGGWLSDRMEAKKLISFLFFVSAGLTFATAPINDLLGQATATWITSQSLWTTRMLVLVIGAFFLPGTTIGMISPAVAKWALDRGFATGATVGAVYSWNTIGSILGTFITGFVLIWQFEIDRIIYLSSAGLAVLGLLFLPAIIWDLFRSSPSKGEEALAISPETSHPTGLFIPSLLVFTSGFSIMLIEMVAGRLVSLHIGSSLFTWTSVIGVILAGISIGNRFGGRLADSFEPLQLIGALFLVASMFCLLVLPSHLMVANANAGWMGRDWIPLDWVADESLTWAVRVFSVVFAAFFMPAAALGTISPAVAKWALDQGRATGSTIGVIYAWNTVGSILGTFATGYFLISMFYVSRIVSFTTVVLALFALVLVFAAGTWLMRIVAVLWFVISITVFQFASMPVFRFEETVLAVAPIEIDPSAYAPDTDLERTKDQMEMARLRFAAQLVSRSDEVNIWDKYYSKNTFEDYDESNYFTIKVGEDEFESTQLDDVVKNKDGSKKLDDDGDPIRRKRKLRKLVLDALVHGYMDINDYKYLHYEYEHLYATVSHRILQKHQEAKQKLKVLFLGGGSYTFPRYLSEYYKDIACEVAEIDPRVTQMVTRSLGYNLAQGKKFYVIGPVEKKEKPAVDKENAETKVKPPIDKKFERIAKALLNSFKPIQPDELRKVYRERVIQSGGFLEDSLAKNVDYVIDLGLDGKDVAEERKTATEMGLKIIPPAEFDTMWKTPSHPNVVTYHMDARQFIMRNDQPGTYDIVYGDAFNDFSVPAHLTTLEFAQEMAKLLKDDGIYMANVIDIWSKSRFMGAYMNTLKKVFKHVYLLSPKEGSPGHIRMTFVLICSNQPVDLNNLGKLKNEIGLVSEVLDGVMMKPVIRGGLFPMRRISVVADGASKSFELPEKCFDVGIVRENGWTFVGANTYDLQKQDDVTRVFFKGSNRVRAGRDIAVVPLTPDEKPVRENFEPGESAVKKRIWRPSAGIDVQSKADRVAIYVTDRIPIEDTDYEVKDGTKVEFKAPPPKGARFTFTLYSDRPIILTDNYCPVDNLCADVAATRVSD